MATYGIGDLQGCCDPLERLLDLIRFDSSTDRLWFVGDLVNRGPQSLLSLRKVISLGNAATTVLGNHDLHLLAASIGVRKLAPSDTLSDILDAPDAAELLDWIRRRKLAHYDHDGKRLLLHAGALPQWTVGDVIARAAEAEAALRGAGWKDFLAHLFSNTPDRWNDDLTGFDRLRVIVNSFTRLRFCTPEGIMEFDTKGSAGDAPPGHMAWFDVPGRRTADATLVFGHWSVEGLVMRPNLLGLDTGCVWGGNLTAVRLEDRKLFQVQCAQARRPN